MRVSVYNIEMIVSGYRHGHIKPLIIVRFHRKSGLLLFIFHSSPFIYQCYSQENSSDHSDQLTLRCHENQKRERQITLFISFRSDDKDNLLDIDNRRTGLFHDKAESIAMSMPCFNPYLQP